MTSVHSTADCRANASRSSSAISRAPRAGLRSPRGSRLHPLPRRTAFRRPLARWHFHEEYELHLITATSGKAFVGDWIGPFQPGHLVLCGPRLPHNWISLDLPEGGVPLRDDRG